MKSHPLASLRRASLVIGAVWLSAGIAPLAQAADQPAQQVAMANTQAHDGSKSLIAQHSPRTARANADVAQTKAARRAPESRNVATAGHDDGSRFVYDSCGCSND